MIPSCRNLSPGARLSQPQRAQSRLGRRLPQSGIALIVTLILLSVVTFLAVAFLFLARRERGAVSTAVEMGVARRAAEAGAEHAKAMVISSIISTTNPFNYDLLVSTNFLRPEGYLTGPANFNLTNVNYDYPSGAPVVGDDFLRNLSSLYYSPRPPVFVRTNLSRGNTAPLDFRYYLDLNQNGRYDTNGRIPELDFTGAPILTLDTNGNSIVLSNFFVGDPEWIGLLERPDRPHSASNQFVGRFAVAVVPSGKTLDINTVHNQAKLPGVTQEGFVRNMGFGPWEMNLASAFVDLNTNYWNPLAAPYFYNNDYSGASVPSTGIAFQDALSLTLYRYNGGWNRLRSVDTLFGGIGATSFRTDFADGYGRGPFMTNTFTPNPDGDQFYNNPRFSWAGDDNPNRFFTVHDFFDRNKTAPVGPAAPNTFTDRLINAGYGNSTYDRYTYYRFISQFGTDSGPDVPKMHLNYSNVVNRAVVPNAQTNFIPWTALGFFTNAVDRMLQANFVSPGDNFRNYGVNSVLSITNIPVWVSNRFVYTPALHRVLQVAANMWDASMNKTANLGADFPTVLRPTFRREPNPFGAGITDIYISGFTEVSTGVDPAAFFNNPSFRPLDLNDPADRAVAGSSGFENRDILGVPWVIGARKGFPNFNEFAMQSIVQMSRTLQLRRPNVNSRPNATNQMFTIGISNVFAFEAWNSYVSNYSRAVDLVVANDVTIAFNFTNDVPNDPRGGGSVARYYLTTNLLSIPANAWRGTGPDLGQPTAVARSFIVPLQTNIIYLSNSIFRTESTPAFVPHTNIGVNLFRGYEQTGKFHIPQFTYAVSNRIRFMMVDKLTGRVVDYVQLNDLNGVRNLTAEVSEELFWITNRVGGNSINHPPRGVINQIEASLGNLNVPDWNSYGVGQASGQTKFKEIDGFRSFMGQAPLYGNSAANTNLAMQAPFTPTRKTSQYLSWQANDPLVHYTAGDMAYLAGSGTRREQPGGAILPLPNIGFLNDRFEPWGGRKSSSAVGNQTPATVPLFSVEAKDPGVRRSDDWDFPTNKFATIGMLGRVHRGTPWQTVYLKANNIGTGQWTRWTGNSNALDAVWSKPVMDRAIFDVFTTAVDENATRGQLNVNQTGLAAWSALLGGVIGLTNTSTDAELNDTPSLVKLEPYLIPPAGTEADPTNAIIAKIHAGVNRVRNTAPYRGSFTGVGDILAVPELTIASPLLNTNSQAQLQLGINDAVYERLPQMLLGLIRGGDQPRFTIYAYGQSLRPANNSKIASGPFYNLCTNYQITAEFATRTVVRVENAPTAPRVVVESFNILPPPE